MQSERPGGGGALPGVLVEGGPRLAASFHEAGLVDRYVSYLAPALLGGSGGAPLLDGRARPTIDEVWRGRITSVRTVGDDLRVDMVPRLLAHTTPTPPTLEES